MLFGFILVWPTGDGWPNSIGIEQGHVPIVRWIQASKLLILNAMLPKRGKQLLLNTTATLTRKIHNGPLDKVQYSAF